MILTAYHQRFLISGAFSPAADVSAAGKNRAFRFNSSKAAGGFLRTHPSGDFSAGRQNSSTCQ
ncbi:MAG: hypothetical protein LBC27_01435 [Spirochaetaceae bacterium]|jgi:hypothetical protein|nr:hypothetical protein [Spirochaetaceae bacterium]